MPAETDNDLQPRLLFTAPWEPVVVRRGDALGLRALADQFADAVAPDLSDRVRDGRWVTILAWCLVRSDAVFHATGGRSVTMRIEQRERYAWLRPLELLWVARTIALTEDHGKKRTLAGQQSVRPWYHKHVNKQHADRFGMSEDQFRAYRQTGMYGGYRIAFRRWPGMTKHGDGWTPGPAASALAKWLDTKLKKVAQPSWLLKADDGEQNSFPTPDKRSRGKEHEWWLRQWKAFDNRGKNADEDTLPRQKDDFEVLPESKLLKPLVFGSDQNGRRREMVAMEIKRSAATSHIEVCEHLGRFFTSEPTIKLLPRFARLADAGMEAMDFMASSLQNESSVTLARVAALPKAAGICEELLAASQDWLENAKIQLRHIRAADDFARKFPIQGASPIECLRALLQHHESCGGGLRWFVLRNGLIEPRTPPRVGSSRYRFRLWSLCRLATQCGVLPKMPRAFDEAEVDETSEVTDE